MIDEHDDDMVPIHISVPKHMKDEIREHVPKGTLSHLVRNFLRIYIHKKKQDKAEESPIDLAIRALMPEEGKDT